MWIKQNQDAIDEVGRRAMQGAGPKDLKDQYILQNLFGVEIDTPIYRIFQSRFFLDDVDSRQLTLVRAGPLVWGDELENPLLNLSYPDPQTGGRIILRRLVEDFFALSWTVDADERECNWRNFSHGHSAIRVRTTPRKLLETLIDTDDEYYMLHYYMGLIRYYPETEIRQWLETAPMDSHLDSLGQKLALSAMTLQSIFSDEQEVRLLYAFKDDNLWVEENVTVNGNTCTVPFDWRDVVEELMIGPNIGSSEADGIRANIRSNGLLCDFTKSKF